MKPERTKKIVTASYPTRHRLWKRAENPLLTYRGDSVQLSAAAQNRSDVENGEIRAFFVRPMVFYLECACKGFFQLIAPALEELPN